MGCPRKQNANVDIYQSPPVDSKFLAEKYSSYIEIVLSWIRQKKTRTDMDTEVFGMLLDAGLAMHYNFLLSLSNLCWGLSSLRIEDSVPTRVLSLDFSVDQISSEPAKKMKRSDSSTSLPGIQLIKARLFIAAWDSDLKYVDPKVSRLLHNAMKVFIKNIMQEAILHKRPSAKSIPIGAMDVWLALKRTNRDRPTSETYGFRDPEKKSCDNLSSKTLTERL
ncbi:Transcriptional adaptor 1 [Nesidiocoris tenuis]|uniref:Transcriptional adaptor 1 n=1 Tax=Nesidiocoris tenuis TaxID=355587 RepID=A0ABN7B5R9_9HEMI|nr:Transcriptional adaptor 1 [Nesidiocoris tenuis]